jgi:xanthine/CO dehydrogenase XdhC/CoxF family maturation factor
MTERSIVEAAARLRRQREPYLIATVVAVRGSAYRRPGARMLLTQFRWIAGSVSGGCLEGDISNKGWWRTRDGEPVVVTYDSRIPEAADDDDVRAAFGLGCDGVVEVMLERAGAVGTIDPLELAHECVRTQKRASIITVFRGTASVPVGKRLVLRAGTESCSEAIGDGELRAEMIADARAAIETGQSRTKTYATAEGPIDAFVEAIVPPPRLFVFGTGHDAVPIVQCARLLGWETFVIAPKPRVSTRERFVNADEVLTAPAGELADRIDSADRAVAIVMGHHYDLDREHVGMLAGTRARYIGVLGPRARTSRMLAELCLTLDDSRIHAPLGLDIGAETPQEIAMAAIAEIQAALRHASGAFLKERQGPIHA